MTWLVEVGYKDGVTDPVGYLIKKEIEDLGIKGVEKVISFNTYGITGEVSEEELKRIGQELLSDNQTQNFGLYGKVVEDIINRSKIKKGWLIEATFKVGVTDAVGMSTLNAIEILGVDGIRNVRTGEKYLIIGDIPEETIDKICRAVLVNPLIQDYSCHMIGGD
jgi:phosphoribosylformylglycinamidine (FGAM) synthase PurS component